MMLNCREASRLISEGMDHELSLTRKFLLKVHLLMCRFCRRYEKQIEFLHRVSRSLAEIPSDTVLAEKDGSPSGLSPQAKERIKKDLSGN